ncbi:MAG TPA: hypothetical protein VF533_18745 [Solirubrobacteraceae bacterium]|jgi:hypothetical protein
MKRSRRLCTLVLALAAVGSALPGAALADLRAGEQGDARDQPDNVSGPRRPDIEQVRVQYDEAGRIDVVFRFYDPLPATDTGSRRVVLSIGAKVDASGSCQTYDTGDVRIGADVATGSSSRQTASVSGYDGTINGTRTQSPDGRELLLSFANTSLASRGYRCVSNVSTYYPDPDGHCAPSYSNCRYISYSYDEDEVANFFFSGFAPPPRPACSNGVDDDRDGVTDSADTGCADAADPDEANPECSDGLDNDGDGDVDMRDGDCGYSPRSPSEGRPPAACDNRRDDDGDGRTDAKDPGCRGDGDGTSEIDPPPVQATFRLKARARRCTVETEVEVLPDLEPERLFPFHNVRITVRGPHYRKTRRLPLGEDEGYVFKRLRPGVYRIRAGYPGDRFRLAPRDVTRRVRVSSRRCRR